MPMLKSLTIENLATIEALEARFEAGLNALTGETGAGKSILVGGLELALGERASVESIRAGATVATVEAVFEAEGNGLAALVRDELELEWDGREPLTLRREISRAGRNRCFVNQQMVTVPILKRLGDRLVDFHGQHEHQSLLHAWAAREALDAFAGHEDLVAAYGAAWTEATRLRRRRDELEKEATDFERRLDYLEFQIQEMDKVGPRPGETAELEKEERHLARAEELARAAAEAYAILYEGPTDEQPALLAQLKEVERRVGEIGEVEADFSAMLEGLATNKAALEDLAFALRDYADSTQADPGRLEEVIGRIEAIRKLIRKHGGSEEAMFAAREAMGREREAMARDDEERRAIQANLSQAEKRLREAGKKLSEGRKAAAEKFAKAVAALLRDLKMEKARFEVAMEPLEEPAAEGLERVEFLLAANPGLPLAPLRKVASGGELSRVMLALKATLARRDAIPTLVFDEIDAGISGETARRVAAVLERLGGSHQVLVITHHAPIAARAARHSSVRKATRRGATYTELVTLDGEARLEELARMMGGDGQAASAKKLARELMG